MISYSGVFDDRIPWLTIYIDGSALALRVGLRDSCDITAGTKQARRGLCDWRAQQLLGIRRFDAKKYPYCLLLNLSSAAPLCGFLSCWSLAVSRFLTVASLLRVRARRFRTSF